MLFSCATCFKLIGADKTATKHKCEKADVESADLIRKDCKLVFFACLFFRLFMARMFW